MNKKIVVGICLVVLIIVCILIIIESEYNVEVNVGKVLPEIDYPSSISNDYVWSNGINVNHYGMGEYTIEQNGKWHDFCGIQYNNFRLMEGSSLYWSEGSSYYGRGFYRFPPDIYRLEFDYNTNRIVIKGI